MIIVAKTAEDRGEIRAEAVRIRVGFRGGKWVGWNQDVPSCWKPRSDIIEALERLTVGEVAELEENENE